MRTNLPVTGHEVSLAQDTIIVSKTDTKGRITWVNRDFIEISGFTEAELIGSPHNIVRHPDMPEAAFANLWSCLQRGQPWVGLVKNRCKNGDHYWVVSHITPMFEDGKATGYQSVRRKASEEQIAHATKIYAELRAERGHQWRLLRGKLTRRNFVHDLNPLWYLSLRVRLSMLAVSVGAFGAALIEAQTLGATPAQLWTLIGTATGFGLYCAHWLSTDIGGRLHTAVQTFRRIAAGDYKQPIDISRNDEVGGVLLGLESMQTRLDADMQDLRLRTIEMARVQQGLDAATTAIMLTDEQFRIIHVNATLRSALRRVEDELRHTRKDFSAAQIEGVSLERFFDDPAAQRRSLQAARSTQTLELPLAHRQFRLLITPVDGSDGTRLGYVAEWQDRTDALAVEKEINAVVSAAARGDFSRRIRLDEGSADDFIRQLVSDFNRVLEINTNALDSIVAVIDGLADGDLTRTLDGRYDGTLARVQTDVNRMVMRLREITGRIKTAAATIGEAAAAIAAGNNDLSRRTEQEAQQLNETAHSVEQLTRTVRDNAGNARHGRELADSATAIAERGGAAVHEVVTTMDALHQLSRKIADITGVIDGIAFQTNILALNSAVEAARAGEHGRGFSVVASEVRTLAQRAADAAKEIKTLITTSVQQIDAGAQRAGAAGNTMQEIIGAVQQVTALMSDIAAASETQSADIEQVNVAITRMDEATQSNAAMVEEASAAARSLEQQTGVLNEAVSVFRLESRGVAAPRLAAVPRATPPPPAETRSAGVA